MASYDPWTATWTLGLNLTVPKKASNGLSFVVFRIRLGLTAKGTDWAFIDNLTDRIFISDPYERIDKDRQVICFIRN